MEERNLNVMFNKAGGNAGKNSLNARITLPKAWLDKMNITPGEREIIAQFDGEQIVIKKKKQPK